MACVTKHTKKICFTGTNARSRAGLCQVLMKNKNKNLLGMNEDEGQAKECKQPINKSINNVTFQRYNNDFMNQ